MSPLGVFYTVREAAKTARLSEKTIRHAIRLRHLSAVRPAGRRRVLIPAVSLEAFIYGHEEGAPMTTGRDASLATAGAGTVSPDRLFEAEPTPELLNS